MTRRRFIVGLAGAAAWRIAARGQTLHRIGFLGDGSPASIENWVQSFRAGLRSLGYVEGSAARQQFSKMVARTIRCITLIRL